jgi:RNA polymerase sigma-70 factor, ECF subfamily
MTTSTGQLDWSSFADRPLNDVTRVAGRRYHWSEQTDAMCVRAVLEGNVDVFSVLVDRHAPACIRYATRMLGSPEDAEDVTQETLVRAHRALARFDDGMSFRTWIMSILINRCRTALLHRRRRTSRVVLDEHVVDRAQVEGSTNDAELRDAIERGLARLDPAQREAFLLKHVESLSYEEMAAATGVGISALKMRVQRACERLQATLQEDLHA